MEELLLKKIEQIEAENKRLRKKIKTLEEKIEFVVNTHELSQLRLEHRRKEDTMWINRELKFFEDKIKSLEKDLYNTDPGW